MRFEDDGDFVFLEDMLTRIKRKAASSDSMFFDSALTIERILLYMRDGEEVKAEQTETEAKKKRPAEHVSIQHGCPKHPKYGAVRAPRTDCETCWKAYKAYHPTAYDQARRKFEYHRRETG